MSEYAKIKRATAIKWIDAAIKAANVNRAEPLMSPKKIVMGQDGRITVEFFRYEERSDFVAALKEITFAAGYEYGHQWGDRDQVSFSLTARDTAFESDLIDLEIRIADRDLEALAADVTGPYITVRSFELATRIATVNRTGETFYLGEDIVLGVFSEAKRIKKNTGYADSGFRTAYALIGDGPIPMPKAILEVSQYQKLTVRGGGNPDLQVYSVEDDRVVLKHLYVWYFEDKNGRPVYTETTAYISRKWGAKKWAAEVSWGSHGSSDLEFVRGFLKAINILTDAAEQWAIALNSPDFFYPLALRPDVRDRD